MAEPKVFSLDRLGPTLYRERISEKIVAVPGVPDVLFVIQSLPSLVMAHCRVPDNRLETLVNYAQCGTFAVIPVAPDGSHGEREYLDCDRTFIGPRNAVQLRTIRQAEFDRTVDTLWIALGMEVEALLNLSEEEVARLLFTEPSEAKSGASAAGGNATTTEPTPSPSSNDGTPHAAEVPPAAEPVTDSGPSPSPDSTSTAEEPNCAEPAVPLPN